MNLSNFEDFRQRMNNKMFFFVEKIVSWINFFGSVNKFCFDVRVRLDGVFQESMGMKRSQNMSNKEKTALRIFSETKTMMSF